MSQEMGGITFSKQFPNPAEPYRGSFVADQIGATAGHVKWCVIAPVPFIPRFLARPLGKPYVVGDGSLRGIPVSRPRYVVLPRRLFYSSVAGSMARAARSAFRSAIAGKPDFVHAHALYPSGTAAARLASAAKVPLVVTVHGSDLYTNLRKKAWRRKLDEVVSAADALIAVSDTLAHDLVSLLGADPSKVTVIPDCYNDALFRPGEQPRADGTLRLISVGRLVPVKGYDVLLDALALLAHQADFRWELTIIGEGPDRAALIGRASHHGIADQVTFAGALPREEIAARLRHSDAFVSSSRREGFGVAIVEALGSGIPVVATRSGGPEGIVGPDDGVLCEPGDPAALADAIGQVAERRRDFSSGAIASRACERFGRERVASQLVQLYRSVSGKGESE